MHWARGALLSPFRLINFASGGGLIFSYKDKYIFIYKRIWRVLNGSYVNHINHVLINTRFKNYLQDVKIVSEADCD